MVKRKQYDSQFKATVALEAVKNQKTIAQIASDYGVHPNQVGKWKKQLLQELPKVFSNRQTSSEKANEKLICAVLYDAKHRNAAHRRSLRLRRVTALPRRRTLSSNWSVKSRT